MGQSKWPVRLMGYAQHLPANIVSVGGTSNLGSHVERLLLGNIGVDEIRHAEPGEAGIINMAVDACAVSLERAGLAPTDVELLILSNWTHRSVGPDLAPRVAHRLGMRGLAFDVAAACAGFVLGVQCAASAIGAGQVSTAVVVASESTSARCYPGSLSQLIAGDGAGAVTVVRDDAAPNLRDLVLTSAGQHYEMSSVSFPGGWMRSKPELVEFAVESLLSVVNELLTRNHLSIGEIDWLVPHLSLAPIIDRLHESAGVPDERFVSVFRERGNLSSASVPTSLAVLADSAQAEPGDLVLAPVVGGGWFSGGLLLAF